MDVAAGAHTDAKAPVRREVFPLEGPEHRVADIGRGFRNLRASRLVQGCARRNGQVDCSPVSAMQVDDGLARPLEHGITDVDDKAHSIGHRGVDPGRSGGPADVYHFFRIELRNRRVALFLRESHQGIEALGPILLEDVDLLAVGEHQQHAGQHPRTGSELDDQGPQEAVIEPVERCSRVEHEDTACGEILGEHFDRAVLEVPSGERRQHLVQIGDDDAPAGLPDGDEELLERDDLRRGQIHQGLLHLPARSPLGLRRSKIRREHLLDVWVSLFFEPRLTRRRLARECHEQRPQFDKPRGSARRDRDPAEVGQEEASVAGPVLPADVDRDVVSSEPRAGGIPDLAILAGGMTDDLRQQRVVVPVVVHLAEVGRENASGLVADFTRQTSLPRMAGPDSENLMRQIASGDPLSLHERAAEHLVHVGDDLLGGARALFAHRRVDDVRKDASMDEQLVMVEIRRAYDQARVSLGVQHRLPDCRPESVPEGVLSALTALPVHVEIVVAERPHDPPSQAVRLSGEAVDEVERLL